MVGFLINSLPKMRLALIRSVKPGGPVFSSSAFFSSTSNATTSQKQENSHILEEFKNLPQKPKLPKTPFQVYFDCRFEEMKKNNPNIRRAQVKEAIKDEWKALEQKTPYEAAHCQEMDHYKVQKEEYDSFIKRQITIKEMIQIIAYLKKFESQKRKERNATKSKYPTNAYKVFMKEYSEQEKSNNRQAPNLSQLSAVFKELSPEEKARFERIAAENKIKLEKELKAKDL